MEKPKGRLREKIDIAVDCMCRLSLGACSIMTCDLSLAASPSLSRSVPDTSRHGSLKKRRSGGCKPPQPACILLTLLCMDACHEHS